MKKQRALLIIDMQIDFCPGGSLPVPKADLIIKPLNRYIAFFKSKKWPVVASRDWHPPITKHFKSSGGLWPEHCVARSKGAQFHPKLKLPSNVKIVSKGTTPIEDGYSAFDSRDQNKKKLSRLLKSLGVKEIFIGGLATDYCIRATALSAMKENFTVYFLKDASKGISAKTSQDAIKLMKEKGIEPIDFTKFRKITG